MKITVDIRNNSKVAIVQSDDILISNVQEALDLMASVQYLEEAHKILMDKSNISEDFFELKTRLAGEILQKFTNYKVKFAIVGDFDVYNSKSLKDFIYESNQGNSVFFLKDKEAALDALHNAD
ncbi:DUF4180 domain-containing protein [Paenibacillus sp. CGMCC 1.16610]|uniref:DUF4180 domain-containing protein n=2 Tax=Paenibacillus TaxID=44249 RepID=A0ABU6DIF9_9BACL|nr:MULTISPECIES: DUF4180 domain-containing protein [Paenibacillus]MBA2941859.1 DUF4180 domain-containing protein [Paenibacillus sp. CGMCC 1.16610]MCY9657768.1 DUF4180 domain-containing protein [Paenibacillus anseongense]MEB4797535.1 DUF4180 domain-containing protein [Paenibacillus chondroitinus]MVQ34377.1 DUF4180 domain-containing protein [Paenibacillus anseongense]